MVHGQLIPFAFKITQDNQIKLGSNTWDKQVKSRKDSFTVDFSASKQEKLFWFSPEMRETQQISINADMFTFGLSNFF